MRLPWGDSEATGNGVPVSQLSIYDLGKMRSGAAGKRPAVVTARGNGGSRGYSDRIFSRHSLLSVGRQDCSFFLQRSSSSSR